MTKQMILISLCLGVAAFGVMREKDGGQLRKMAQRISDGHTIAWARHITGQDVNDLTSSDDFNSVAVIPGGAGVQNEDEVWVVTQRTIDGNDYRFIEQFTPVDWGDDPNWCWFVDCAGDGTTYQPGQAEIPAIPAVPATYTYTWLSENGQIWGVPLNNGGLGITLANGGSAINEGGGIVSLPLASNPFVSGNVVYINGTTNYNGAQTLTAGTTATRIHFTDTYGAETFDGTETVVRYIDSLTASAGRMIQDSSGNLYYGHNWDAVNETYVTKIAPDGTLSYPLDNTTWLTWPLRASYTVLGLAISDDGFLYLLIPGTLCPEPTQKFNLSNGSKIWGNANGGDYDLDIDSSGNAYAPVSNNVNKFAAATGSNTALTLMGAPAAGYVTALALYDVTVDNTLGIAIAGGQQYCAVAQDESVLYNLAVRTFDNSAGSRIAVGGTYIQAGIADYTYLIGTGHVAMNGSHIFVMIAGATGRELYKYSWNGSSLTEVTHITSSATHASGIYFDLWGNLVVVNNDGSNNDIFWFYDTNLNYLSKVENLHLSMLDSWLAGAGSAWQQGNALPNGDLGTPEVPGQPAIPEEWFDGPGTQLNGAQVCVYADAIPRGTFTMDGNDILGFTEANYSVIIAGLNYYSIYESFPIVGGTQYGPTQTQKAQITDVRLDFFETLGANIGVSLTESSEIVFSEDDFATQMDPYTGPKIVTFPRGTSRTPTIFIWAWDPVSCCIRAIYPTANIFFEGE